MAHGRDTMQGIQAGSWVALLHQCCIVYVWIVCSVGYGRKELLKTTPFTRQSYYLGPQAYVIAAAASYLHKEPTALTSAATTAVQRLYPRPRLPLRNPSPPHIASIIPPPLNPSAQRFNPLPPRPTSPPHHAWPPPPSNASTGSPHAPPLFTNSLSIEDEKPVETETFRDKQRYSRQLLALGGTTQQRLQNASVLVSGLQGPGVELAKNLIVMGVRHLALHDPTPTTYNDLASQFCLTEKDVQFPRAHRSLQTLQSLSYKTNVTIIDETNLSLALLRQYDVVVLVNWRQKGAIHINQICRKLQVEPIEESSQLHNAAAPRSKPLFVYIMSKGLSGFVFTDFGSNFTVEKPFDTNPEVVRITGLQKGFPTVFYCNMTQEGDEHLSGNPHDLETGDYIMLELQSDGMNATMSPLKVEVDSPASFSVCIDSTKWDNDAKRGTFQKLVFPKQMEFRDLEASLTHPEFVTWDYEKIGREKALLACFTVLEKYMDKYKRPPRSGHSEDADRFMVLWKSVWGLNYMKLAEVFSRTSRGDLAPVAAILGGIAAQEVIKGVSHMSTPIKQFVIFDGTEAMPHPLPSYQHCRPQHNRYDGQIAVFGKDFQTQLSKLSIFIVGIGAIGSELLKNLALMGVSSDASPLLKRMVVHSLMVSAKCLRHCLIYTFNVQSKSLNNFIAYMKYLLVSPGRLYLADMDVIEESNLSRQLLYRASDVLKYKADVAAERIKRINPSLRVISYNKTVSKMSEDTFDDGFWESVDAVFNALDNIPSRMYVDSRCVYYGKPLFESGTLGAKGNTQVVIPFLTEPYGHSVDNIDDSIPVCTIKGFPFQIEHTIQWALQLFDQLFVSQPSLVSQLLQDPSKLLSQYAQQDPSSLRAFLQLLFTEFIIEKPLNFGDCLLWAKQKFSDLFVSNIEKLLHDISNEEYKEKCKAFGKPRVHTFNFRNPMHLNFLKAAAVIRACTYNISIPHSVHSSLFLQTMLLEAMQAHQLRIRYRNDKISVIKQFPLLSVEDYYRIYTERFTDGPFSNLFRSLLLLYEACLQKYNVVKDVHTEKHFSHYKFLFLDAHGHNQVTECEVLTLLAQILNYLIMQHASGSSETALYGRLPVKRNAQITDSSSGVGEPPQSCTMDLDSSNNQHLEFLAYSSNLRAQNFNIPTVEISVIKQLAAKIVPAIATITAVVAGLSCLELYKATMLGYCDKRLLEDSVLSKVLKRHIHSSKFSGSFSSFRGDGTKLLGHSAPMEHLLRFKNSFINLAVPFFAMSYPLCSPKAWINTGRLEGLEYSVWDYVKLDGSKDLTLKEFMSYFEKEFGINVEMISADEIVIYSKQEKDELDTTFPQSNEKQSTFPSLFGSKRKSDMTGYTGINSIGQHKHSDIRLNTKMESVIRDAFQEVGERFPASFKQRYILLDVSGVNKDTNEEIEMPPVCYRFKHD